MAATPQCCMPDKYLDKAIKTDLFDYVLVQFYNNPPCQYDPINSNATLLLQSWNAWTSLVLPNNTIFMGLPAAPNAAPSGGYIPPTDLISKVLPFIKPVKLVIFLFLRFQVIILYSCSLYYHRNHCITILLVL